MQTDAILQKCTWDAQKTCASYMQGIGHKLRTPVLLH